jgi:cytidyltransferase-like protein
MDNLKNIQDFITEKRVTVKRRYTEKHPAKNVSTAARVRSAILDAVADGHLTEDEVNNILSEIKAHKRWLKRNVGLFNISEDETGIKRYSLSPYGHRVRTATAPINEALKVPHKEQGKKKVNMFVGRFQPFTLGHVKVFEKMYKENGKPVVVFLVRGKNNDPEKRPFDEEMQQAMFAKMAKQYPFLETAIVVPNGAIDTMFAAARPAYEPVMWGYGTDRKKSYGAMIDKQSYRDQLGVDPDFKGYEIFRTDDNISASKVRNALKIDDEKTFKKMTPKSIHSFYKPLQNILEPIKENNNNMKNLKSLTNFSIDESLNEGKKAKAKSPNKVNTIEGEINEDYIELMPEIANALGKIQMDWDRWKNGPMTEPSDIKPAAKELKGWITRWMKQNIK